MKNKIQNIAIVSALIVLSALAIHPGRKKPSKVNEWIAEHQKHIHADQAWGGSYTVTLYAQK
jgi:hypothetical protein